MSPRKSLRPCLYPGCGALVESGRCKNHQDAGKQKTKEYNRKRYIETGHLYDIRWRKIREMVLRDEPLCRECGKRGIVKAADEVHHVVPLAAGGTHDESNLVPLCKACHSRHTAREGGGFGNAGGKVAKACTVDGAPVDDRHHWNR